jgi:tRNA G18 (ribose-2'-O)-methylase SpoU
MRGYYGIAVYHPKTEVNIGTLWRSAYLYDAAFIATIGRRYSPQASDTTNTDRHIPLYEYTNFEEFLRNRPFGCLIVAVEQYGSQLGEFHHPERCIYLLGAEDYGLPQNILAQCDYHIELESPKKISMNVATAGAIVMYDRYQSRKDKS